MVLRQGLPFSPSAPLRPVDRWVAFVNLLMLTTWLPLAPHTAVARWGVGIHLAGLALPWLLARAPGPHPGPIQWLRDHYPLLLILAFWSELAIRHQQLPTYANDPIVADWDLGLFGLHLNLEWVRRMPWTWLSEILQAAYFGYYLMLLSVPIALHLLRGAADRHEFVLRLAVTYLACFTLYMFFPVVGPRELWGIHAGDLTQGFFYQLNLAIRTGGDALGTAFPSSHTAGSITFAWIAWRFGPRWLAALTTGLAALIVLATVYTQNHLAIDTAAGIVAALGLQGVVVSVLLAPSPEPQGTETPSSLGADLT